MPRNEDLCKACRDLPGSTWTEKARIRLGASVPQQQAGTGDQERCPGRRLLLGKKTPAGVVKNIRHWSHGAYTRIVIEQNTPVKFLAQELKNPDRLVFDLLHARVERRCIRNRSSSMMAS